MAEKKPRVINCDGYVLLDRNELSRLLAIESRANSKLTQLQTATEDVGRERRMAHIEALEFVLGVAFTTSGKVSGNDE